MRRGEGTQPTITRTRYVLSLCADPNWPSERLVPRPDILEIELLNADDCIGFSSALFIFYRNRCAKRDAVRSPFRRSDHLDRGQNSF